jgi:hypothetical protein
MKLENQVCTYEQAVTLKEFGLRQQAAFFYVKTCSQAHRENCSLFFGIDAALKQYNAWAKHDAFLQSQTEEPVAAWNATELGVLLPDAFKQPRNTVDLFTYKKEHCFATPNEHAFGAPKTRYFCSLNVGELLKQQFFSEAHVRAATLIYLLETNHITIEEINLKITFN